MAQRDPSAKSLNASTWEACVKHVPKDIRKAVIDTKSLDYILVHSETASLLKTFLKQQSKHHYLEYYSSSTKLWDSDNFHADLKVLYDNFLDRKLPSSRKVEVRTVSPSQKKCVKSFALNADSAPLVEVRDAVLKLQEAVYGELEQIVKSQFIEELIKYS